MGMKHGVCCLVGTVLSAGCLALCLLAVGCEDLSGDSRHHREETDILPWASISNGFAIVWPQNGEIVSNRVIDVIGVGFHQGVDMEVSVKTDIWYSQGHGPLDTSPNGSWRFRGVVLGGWDHIIRATATFTNGSRKASQITVTREW